MMKKEELKWQIQLTKAAIKNGCTDLYTIKYLKALEGYLGSGSSFDFDNEHDKQDADDLNQFIETL